MATCSDSVAGVLDLSAALENLGGDLELLQEAAAIFLSESVSMREKAVAAVAAADAKAIHHSAHSIKGCVGNFGAAAAFRAASELEQIGRSGDLSEAPQALERLQHELSRVTPELSRLVAGG
jgi:HPt (histidine-containing phosphotransfer) domain-containing protein